MLSCRLTRIVSNHDNLRDSIIDGYIFDIPQEGQSLVFVAAPRDIPSGHRRVTTSPIVQLTVESENCLVLKTLNSVYKLSDIKELDDEESLTFSNSVN